MKRFSGVFCLFLNAFLFVGCMSENVYDSDNTAGTNGSTSNGTAIATTENKASADYGYDEIYSPTADDSYSNYNFANTCTITYSGSEATISNLPDSVTVTSNSNGDVILTSTTGKNVCYKLSGSGTGSFKLYSDHLYKVELAGLTLTNNAGPAINLQSKKRSFIVADEETTNTLADGSTYASSTEDQKGTIFSEGQMVFCGTGTIKVSSAAKHAICTDQYMIMDSGTITVPSASSDGIHVDTRFIMEGGTLNINSAGDGIQAEGGNICINGGTINITTSGDTSHGFKSERYFRATGGTATVNVNGKGSKCIKGNADIIFTGGSYTLTTSGTSLYENSDLTNPACIKADSCIYIKGTALTCKSTGAGGKGINSDNDMKIDGGTIGVTTTGGEYKYSTSLTSSAKGICSETNIMINGGSTTVSTTKADGDEGVESKNTFIMNDGELTVTSYDDAINAGAALYIQGGKVYAYSSNNDAIDSNGSLTIGGGVVLANCASGNVEEGIDCDNNSINLSGGIVFSMGGAQGNGASAPTSSTATQCTALISLNLTKGQYRSINASDGTNIFTYYIPATLSQSYSLLSSPNFVNGSTYTVTTGSSAPTDATSTWNGLYLGSSCKGSSSLTSFTFSSTYYGTSSTNTTPGGGNHPGGGW